MRAALGESWMPAPVSSSRSACSSTMTRKPLRASASAAVNPPMPAPATMTMREDVRARAPAPAAQTRNVVQGAFRRPRGMRRAASGRSGRASSNRGRRTRHRPPCRKHMRMVERRRGAHAHEFLGADLDDRNAGVVVEVGNDRLSHARVRLAARHHSGATRGFPVMHRQKSRSAMHPMRHRTGLFRGACHRAGHSGPDPLARNDGGDGYDAVWPLRRTG